MFRKPGQNGKENHNKTDYIHLSVEDEDEGTARHKESYMPRNSFKEASSKGLKQYLRPEAGHIEKNKQKEPYLPIKKASSKSPQQLNTKKNNILNQISTAKLENTINQLATKIQSSAIAVQNVYHPTVSTQNYVNQHAHKVPPSPNFSALINSMKQKEQSREREVTPRSIKGVAVSDPKQKPKPMGVKFR